MKKKPKDTLADVFFILRRFLARVRIQTWSQCWMLAVLLKRFSIWNDKAISHTTPCKTYSDYIANFFFFFFFTAEVHTCCLPPSLPLLFLCFHSIVKPMSFLHRANGKQEEYILQLMLVIYILSPEGIYYLVVYCSKTHRTPQWRLTTVWESSKMQQNIWVTPDWCLFIQPHSLPHPFSLPPVGC